MSKTVFSDSLLNPDVIKNDGVGSNSSSSGGGGGASAAAAAEASKGRSVVIVGAGLVGSLAAVVLARRGWHVDLYEAREDIRKTEAYAGRSINLALSYRGIRALQIGGVDRAVVRDGIPMRARMIHSLDGRQSPQPYGRDGQHILSVDRRKLNEHLLNEAETMSNVRLHFEHKLVSADLEGGEVEFELADGTRRKVTSDFTIGADGAYSGIRKQMLRRARFDYSQTYIPHGYKELCIPADEEGRFKMDGNSLHIWPRQTFMMIALPNPDKSYTVTLFMPFDKFDKLKNEGDVLRFFRAEFPDAINLVGRERLLRDFFANPTSPLMSVKCSPYHMGRHFLIIGDAAHAMVPFYGQGMNAGFEDVIVLNALLEEYADDISKALPEFSARRAEDAHAICDLAMYNYVEMRAGVSSRAYLLRKRLDGLLNRLAPNSWIPLYSMVSFSAIPYAQVIAQRAHQDAMLTKAIRFAGLGLAMAAAALAHRRLCR